MLYYQCCRCLEMFVKIFQHFFASRWPSMLGNVPVLNITKFTNFRPKMAAFSLKTFRLFIRERGLGFNKRRLNSHKRKRKYDHRITHSIVSFENYQTTYTYFRTTHCQTMMLAIFNFSIFCSQYRNAAYIHTPQH